MKFVKIIYCSINHLALRNFRTICIYVQYLSENTLCLCIAFDHALNYPLLLAGFNFSIILNSECYICLFILHTIDKAHWNSKKKLTFNEENVPPKCASFKEKFKMHVYGKLQSSKTWDEKIYNEKENKKLDAFWTSSLKSSPFQV